MKSKGISQVHCETKKKDTTNLATENFLEKYIKFRGISGNLRCDQAQAFNSKQFHISGKDGSKKLILAHAGDLYDRYDLEWQFGLNSQCRQSKENYQS